MNTRFENFMSMVVRERDHLNQNAGIMSPINKYTDTKTSYDGHIAEAEVTGMQQQSNNTGQAILKKQRKLEMVDWLVKIITVLIAYATFENDPVLLGQVKKSRSILQKMAINSLKGFAQEIFSLAKTLNGSLEAYGLTQTMIDNFETAIAAFVEVMQTPQMGKGLRKQLTSQLGLIRKALEGDLDKLDKLVDLLKDTEPVFYAQYYNMRRIDDNGTGKVALIAKATDAATGMGMKKVTFTFVLNGNGGKEAGTDMMKSVKRTATHGGFRIKKLGEGTYTCMVEREGYITQTMMVYVNAGEMTRVKVALEKAA